MVYFLFACSFSPSMGGVELAFEDMLYDYSLDMWSLGRGGRLRWCRWAAEVIAS